MPRATSTRAAGGSTANTAASGAPRTRHPALDALRGTAIAAMIGYHFCFDLAWFELLRADFYRDPFWLAARTTIVSTFLGIAGASLHLAARRPDFERAFWRRLTQVAGAALLVSAGSYAVFPQRFIYFGVLHAIALSMLLTRPLARHPVAAVVAGSLVVLAGNVFAHPEFDARPLNWIGFATRKPATEDYVPLFPWLGVVMIGVGVGAAVLARPRWLSVLDRHAPRWLALAGRHSLVIYLLHQPLLIALLWSFAGR